MEDDRVVPPKQIGPDRAKERDDLNIGDADDDIPKLILPPGPPSTSGVPSNGTEDEGPSSCTKHPIHVRDNSLETTSSQSMDLSSFIKSLELQEGQSNPQPGMDDQKNADVGSDTPVSGSLSLAASQVDLSFADETEGIRVDGVTDEIDDNDPSYSFHASNGVNNNADSCSNSNEVISDKFKSNENADSNTSASKDASMVVHLPKHASYRADSNHDPSAMTHVGEQLFRESLEAGKKEVEKEESQITTASDSSDTTPPKRKSNASTMTKVVILTVFVIIGATLVVCRIGKTRQNDVAKDAVVLDVNDLINEKYQGSSEINPWMQNTTDRFQNPKQEQKEETNSDGANKTVLQYYSSPRVSEGRKNHGNNDQSQEAINRIQFSDGEQLSVKKEKNYDPNDVILYQSSACINEERTKNDNCENPQETTSRVQNLMHEKIDVEEENASSHSLHKDTRHKLNSKSDDDWSFSCIWLVILLLVVSRLISSLLPASHPISLLKEEAKMESRVSVKSEATPPFTPTRASRSRSQDGFLTPPLSHKNGSHEPTKWMSPVYGEGALDVSVYKAMKAVELRELLRDRKCDTRGSKEQMIKMLVQSYQNELACLTVQQLRPKLRKRNLSQKGTKKDVIRRLVEAGPI